MKQLPTLGLVAAGVGAKPHAAAFLPNLVSGVCLALGVPSNVLWEHSLFCLCSQFYFLKTLPVLKAELKCLPYNSTRYLSGGLRDSK